MRKRTKLLYERVSSCEDRLKLYSERLKVLECGHTSTVLVEKKEPMFGQFGEWYGRYTIFYKEKCSKCGKVLRDLTEIEYLRACLERDESSFLGMSNEMKKRLAKLEEEESK